MRRANGVEYVGRSERVVLAIEAAERRLIVASAGRSGFVVPLLDAAAYVAAEKLAEKERRAANRILRAAGTVLTRMALAIQNPEERSAFVYGLPPHWFC